jgi:hypothetical protein
MTRRFLLVLHEVMAIGKTRNQLDASSDLHIGFHHAMIALSTSPWRAMMTESWVIHRCAMRAWTIGENDRAQWKRTRRIWTRDSSPPLWGDEKAAGAGGLSGDDHKGERYG